MIKVMIVDDQTLMRDGLKTIIELEDDIEVVELAENGKDALDKFSQIDVDVILMDIRMPMMNGVEAVQSIKALEKPVSILMLTTFDDEEYIIEALANGADGYLLKDIQADKLIQYIRDCYRGEVMLPNKIAQKLTKRLIEKRNDMDTLEDNIQTLSIESFSDRELEIVQLMVEGFNNRQIAAKLFISEGTVKNYVSNIYSKFGTNDRAKVILSIQKLMK